MSELPITGFSGRYDAQKLLLTKHDLFLDKSDPSDDEYELYNFNRNDIADKHYYEGRICNGMDDS